MSLLDLSVIVVGYKRLDYLANCLNSLYTHVHCPFEIYLVMNGYDRSQRTFCEDWSSKENLHLWLNTRNEGKGKAVNKVLEHCKGTYIANIDDDVEVCKGWAETLIDAYPKIHKVGFIGSVPMNYDVELVNVAEYDDYSFADTYFGGWVIFASAKLWARVHGYSINLIYGRDDLYIQRKADKLGLRCGYLLDSNVRHGYLDDTAYRDYRTWKDKILESGKWPKVGYYDGASTDNS